MKTNPLTLAIGILLILIFGLLLFTFQVRTTQVAVVTTFGNPTKDITEPNLYFKWPWPVQKVYWFEKPVQNLEEDKFTEDLTADNNNLLTMVYVGWRIAEPKSFFPKFGGSAADAEKVLTSVVRSTKSAVVGKHPLSDFVSADGNGRKFAAIEREMLLAIQAQVRANHYGIEIEFLGIKKLGLPESVTQSVFERMTSERQVLVSQLQNEGEAEAQKIRSTAERRAAETLAVAKGEATQIRGKGEAEAAKYLAAFQQNPELANFLLNLNALEEVLKNRSTLVLDQQTPPFDLFRAWSTNRMTK